MILQQSPIPNFLFEELKVRAKIGLFIILAWQLSLVIYPPIKHPALMMLIASLVDIASIVVINRFCGERSIGHDINELGCYGIMLHMIAIPAYYYTEIPVEYHNNGMWIILFLALARLVYFGPQTKDGDYKGLPAFGILSHVQNLYVEHVQKNKQAFQHWSELLFFGSAAPLWFIIWKTNDQAITITVIGVMLFIYLISSNMPKALTFEDRKALALALFEEFKPSIITDANGKLDIQSAVSADAIAEHLKDARSTVEFLKGEIKFLVITAGLLLISGLLIYHGNKEQMFGFGYASGYTDGKTGLQPKAETDFDKLKRCYLDRQEGKLSMLNPDAAECWVKPN